MFSIKKIVFIVLSSMTIGSAIILINHQRETNDLKKIIESIDLNKMEGNFIVVTGYNDSILYTIDEVQLKKELNNYINSIDSSVSFSFEIENNNVIKISYKKKNAKISKKYTLINKSV